MRQRFKSDVDSLMSRSTWPGTDSGNSSGAEQPPRAAARASRDCVEPGGGGTGSTGTQMARNDAKKNKKAKLAATKDTEPRE